MDTLAKTAQNSFISIPNYPSLDCANRYIFVCSRIDKVICINKHFEEQRIILQICVVLIK